MDGAIEQLGSADRGFAWRRAGGRSTLVPFDGTDRQHAAISAQLEAAFRRVADSNAVALGEEVARFETDFARLCGATHCVGVGSGTAALTIALIAAGIGDGDEVIVPAHGSIATALAVVHAGAVPIVCEVRESDGLLDADAARALVSPRTRAIVPVHLYGQLCDLRFLRELADRYNLMLLEDASHSHGARPAQGRAAPRGDAAAFSLGPGKNLGGLGDGGAICTDDADLAAAARRLRDLGRSRHGRHLTAGFSARLDGLQAAFLRVKLASLEGWNERRGLIATLYRQHLPGHLRPLPPRGEACVFHRFPIRTVERERLRAALAEAGIEAGIPHGVAVSDQPAVSAGCRGEFPRAEAWAREELCLPLYPELSNAEAGHVIEQVARSSA